MSASASTAVAEQIGFFRNPASHPAVLDVFKVAFLSTPLLFLLQVAALVLLLRQVVFLKSANTLGARLAGRWLLQLGVTFAPVIMLLVSVVFVGDYQEQYGHWFFHINDGLAGLTLMPMYVVGSLVVARGISRPEFRLRSGLHYLVLMTLMTVCAWYVFSTGVLDMVTDGLMDMNYAAIVPAVAAINYALLVADINHHGQLERPRRPAVIAWFSALTVSVVVKVPLAMRFFASLPVERPAGYGDCFVVSAAARGHECFVGSHYDPTLGRNVNGQLRTLRAFEEKLARLHPAFHGRLRRLYNRVGPPVAACIRSPFIADLVYLLLKPIEWLARIYLAGRQVI